METNVKSAKISVIVPVYNTPTLHLNRCIDSLLEQDYSNAEIILVDDGSDPDCQADLDALAARDDRIRLFHKPNGGVSSARNYGMKNMTGSNVKLDDGEFEVTLIKMPQNPIQLNEILANLVMPKDIETPYIYTFKTDHIRIHCDDYVPWTLDGEFGGEHKNVEIYNRCRRISFMVEK